MFSLLLLFGEALQLAEALVPEFLEKLFEIVETFRPDAVETARAVPPF